jgi:hypothetical protein
MKFKFKIQKYQADAVEAVVNVFEGQPAIVQQLVGLLSIWMYRLMPSMMWIHKI